MGVLKITLIIIVAIVAILGGFIGKLVLDAGVFKTLNYHGSDFCTLIGKDKVQGAEDFAVDYSSGIAYFGSSTRMYISPSFSNKTHEQKMMDTPRGELWAYTLPRGAEKEKPADSRLKKLTIVGFDNFDLHPHGVSFFSHTNKDGQEEKFLYVINHRRDGEAVDAFKITEDGISVDHVWSALHPEGMRNINDLHAVSSNTFYVTNWHYYEPDELMYKVEQLGKRPWTWASFCEVTKQSSLKNGFETTCKVVADNLVMANGINGNKDNSKIYIAEALGKKMNLFNREKDNTLTLEKKLDCDSACDNIEVEPQSGCLLSGCHPKLFDFVAHAKSPSTTIAPSHVLVFDPNLDNIKPVEVFLSDGSDLSASSVAFIDRQSKVMLIGGVFAPGFLECAEPEINYSDCSYTK